MSLSASDDFERADGSAGSNWIPAYSGAPLPVIESGTLTIDSTNPLDGGFGFWVDPATTSSQFSEAEVADSYLQSSVVVRGDATTGTYYLFEWYAGDNFYLIQNDPFAILETASAPGAGAGTIRIEIDEDDQITCYFNGSSVITYDASSSPLVGSHVGVVLTALDVGTRPNFESWQGGDFTPPLNVDGTASATLGSISSVVTGVPDVAGTATSTLGGIASVVTVSSLIDGTGLATLGGVVSNGQQLQRQHRLTLLGAVFSNPCR